MCNIFHAHNLTFGCDVLAFWGIDSCPIHLILLPPLTAVSQVCLKLFWNIYRFIMGMAFVWVTVLVFCFCPRDLIWTNWLNWWVWPWVPDQNTFSQHPKTMGLTGKWMWHNVWANRTGYSVLCISGAMGFVPIPIGWLHFGSELSINRVYIKSKPDCHNREVLCHFKALLKVNTMWICFKLRKMGKTEIWVSVFLNILYVWRGTNIPALHLE